MKYHIGATGIFTGASGGKLRIHLVSNPSHLEAVDPVAEGRARAKQTRIGRDGKLKSSAAHHAWRRGFRRAGNHRRNVEPCRLFVATPSAATVHIIVNNLIGFTAEPQ